MTKKIYIAGPLFNTHEKGYLEKIAIELESNDFECFLPHRDQKGLTEEELKELDMSDATKEKIFNNDLDALKTSDYNCSSTNWTGHRFWNGGRNWL